MKSGFLILISGEYGSGKSKLCQAVADEAQQRGWQLSGILSPGEWQNGQPIGKYAKNNKTGEIRPLAFTSPHSKADLHLGDWYFDQDTLAWGNSILQHSTPSGLLIVDELGPLELLLHEGWQYGIKALQSQQYQAALVVIRPELIAVARQVFPVRSEICIENVSCLPKLANDVLIKISHFFNHNRR